MVESCERPEVRKIRWADVSDDEDDAFAPSNPARLIVPIAAPLKQGRCPTPYSMGARGATRHVRWDTLPSHSLTPQKLHAMLAHLTLSKSKSEHEHLRRVFHDLPHATVTQSMYARRADRHTTVMVVPLYTLNGLRMRAMMVVAADCNVEGFLTCVRDAGFSLEPLTGDKAPFVGGQVCHAIMRIKFDKRVSLAPFPAIGAAIHLIGV